MIDGIILLTEIIEENTFVPSPVVWKYPIYKLTECLYMNQHDKGAHVIRRETT